MPRPKCRCRILSKFKCPCFKPVGISRRELESVELTEEECEAIRLKDLEGFSQADCAEKMHISQPTFHRLLTSARRKIADGLINGKSINISE